MAAPKQNRDNSASKSLTESPEIDDELNELLDSALADFGSDERPGTSEPVGATAGAGTSGAGPHDTQATSSADDSISDKFVEEFSEEMSKQFEDAMKSFMAEDPEMLQQIEKLAEVASNTGESPSAQKEFGETLKETLSSLAQNTEGLQDHSPGGPDEMMKMFSGMGLGEPSDEATFMPMMQGMMKTLLSKDVLYPSLKEISEKYPKWLEDNKSKVPGTEFSNYSKQYEIIGRILTEFESEKATDTDDAKRQRFEKVMDLMQEMQDLGQPPKEIVGDVAPGLNLDGNGVPTFPGSSDSCSVM